MRVCLLIAGALVGCGPAPIPTVSLAGTVTLDGNPLKVGTIVFHPDDIKLGIVAANIKDGKFEAPVVPQGTYKAAIMMPADDTKPMDSTFGTPDKKNPPAVVVPAKYREPTIPVDASQPNQSLKIELKSK